MLSSASAVLLAAATLPLLSSANPLPRQATRPAKRSTFFHNTQNASNTEFNPLHHLAGIAPYFDSPGVELNPSPPNGSVVEKAAYLVRHSSIEANEYDYESSLEPFLSKLVNFTASSTNASLFFNTSLSFLATYTPLLNIENATGQISHVPESGRKDAYALGQKFAEYMPALLPNGSTAGNESFKIWTASANRDIDTSESFSQGLFANSTYEPEIIVVGEGELAAANTLTPHETCEAYSGSAGSEEQSVWTNIYAQPIADRLNTEIPEFNFTVADVFAMQQLCGYDTVISGNLSSFCNSTAFTNEDWLSFEYANDLQYHYNLGYGFTESPSLGVPYLLAVTDFLLGSNLSTTLTEDYTDASNMTTPTEANATATQSLLISFSHREEPAFLATALGIFNNSVGIAANETDMLDVPTNMTMSSTENDKGRAWKTSELLPFLGHVGVEKLVFPIYPPGNDTYIRVMVNHAPIPIPACNSGPDRSCPAPQFIEFMQQRKELYGDFTTACELEDQKNATDVFSIFTGNVLP